MIIALVIFNFCYIFVIKGVPLWLECVLAIVSTICIGVALIIWEETKDKIKHLENQLKKMKGGEEE